MSRKLNSDPPNSSPETEQQGSVLAASNNSNNSATMASTGSSSSSSCCNSNSPGDTRRGANGVGGTFPASPHEHQAALSALGHVSDFDFCKVLEAVRAAIDADAQPMRIGQGSSGSYFCRNTDGLILGVFKPKCEEPYGLLNPKWSKWIHRNFCCCCFGRGCLLPNVGYISETGASVLARALCLDIVPRTELVALASPAFHYNSSVRKRALERGTSELPTKIGSFQLFLRGFLDASVFLQRHPLPSLVPNAPCTLLAVSSNGVYSEINKTIEQEEKDDPMDVVQPLLPVDHTEQTSIWSNVTYLDFLEKFQHLVVLDYAMRNTDRGSDNWMLRYDEALKLVELAAIDHGLAFPYKHPDQWRSYPYGWLGLEISAVPFLPSVRQHVLARISSAAWWARTRRSIADLFSLDEDFSPRAFDMQMAVLRGQLLNLQRALETPESSPEQLCMARPLLVFRRPRNERNAAAAAAAAAEAADEAAAMAANQTPLSQPETCVNISSSENDSPVDRRLTIDNEVIGEWSEDEDDDGDEHEGQAEHATQHMHKNDQNEPDDGCIDCVYIGGGERAVWSPSHVRGHGRGVAVLRGPLAPQYARQGVLRAAWLRTKNRVKTGGRSFIRRVRHVIVETRAQPWFRHW